MTEVSPRAEAADALTEEGGYKPELKRTLGSFQVFAVSFAFISVAVGIFGTYDDVLQNAGPVGIWLWPIVAVGQTLIALVIAQFAARIPLSGSSYQWASRLANPKIGWLFGWLGFSYLATRRGDVDNALASTALMPLFGMPPDEDTARVITLVVLVIQAVLVISSTRLVGLITSAAVGLELVIVVVLTVALVHRRRWSPARARSATSPRAVYAEGAPNYFAVGGGLMAAMIMGIATLVGFDSAANMAEEAKNPFRSGSSRDRGIRCGGGGSGHGVRDCAHDRDRGHASGQRDRLAGCVDLARPTGSCDGASAAGRHRVRILRRGAGDSGHVRPDGIRDVARRPLPRSPVDASRNPRTSTPIPATILIVVLGFVLMAVLPGDALLEMLTVGGLIGAILYGLIIVLYLGVRKRLGRQENAFDLGRFEMPVAIAALVWSAVVVFVLVSPPEALTADLIAVGVVLLGGGVPRLPVHQQSRGAGNRTGRGGCLQALTRRGRSSAGGANSPSADLDAHGRDSMYSLPVISYPTAVGHRYPGRQRRLGLRSGGSN